MPNIALIGCRRFPGGKSSERNLPVWAGLVLTLAVAIFLSSSAPSGAQTQDPSLGGAKYRIGSGDVLNVEVVGRRDLSAQYTVGQDGVLFMPLTGGINAEGKTSAELAAELARRLSLYDRDISQVNVSVAEFRSRRISVLGAVLHPGRFSFAQLPNVWDAITEAGGPADDAQLSAVEIIPSDQGTGQPARVVDVAAAIREGRVRNLERLRPGDTVRVPKGLPGSGLATVSSVFMFGAITRPGPLPVERQIDLMTAVTQSGGPTPDANLKKVRIVRGKGASTVRMKVNLSDYIDKANMAGNPTLLAGDTVILTRQGSGFMSLVRTLSPIVALASAVVILVRR